MADWVHCNLCFQQPGSGRKFSLTSCGHIYCDECVSAGTKLKCKLCGNQCTTVQLSSKMKPDVEIFFTDPAEIIKRHQKQLVQVMDFQKHHRQRFVAFIREKLARQANMMVKAQQAVDHSKDLEREIMVLKEENAYLKKLISSMGGCQGNRPSTGMAARGHSGGPGLSQRTQSHGASPSYSSFNSPYHARSHSAKSSYSTDRVSLTQGHGSHTLRGPARVSVRTPPSNGRIGVIPCTPSPSMTSHVRYGGAARPDEASLPSPAATPMSCSPVTYQRASGRTPGVPIDSCDTRTPGTHCSSLEMFATPKRRDIQTPGRDERR